LKILNFYHNNIDIRTPLYFGPGFVGLSRTFINRWLKGQDLAVLGIEY